MHSSTLVAAVLLHDQSTLAEPSTSVAFIVAGSGKLVTLTRAELLRLWHLRTVGRHFCPPLPLCTQRLLRTLRHVFHFGVAAIGPRRRWWTRARRRQRFLGPSRRQWLRELGEVIKYWMLAVPMAVPCRAPHCLAAFFPLPHRQRERARGLAASDWRFRLCPRSLRRGRSGDSVTGCSRRRRLSRQLGVCIRQAWCGRGTHQHSMGLVLIEPAGLESAELSFLALVDIALQPQAGGRGGGSSRRATRGRWCGGWLLLPTVKRQHLRYRR